MMLSVKSDRPVKESALSVIRAIARTTCELKLPYFIAGAMARDIVLTNVFGIETGRATRDVDFAVAVKDWDEFEAVRNKLITRENFNPDEKRIHRLYFKGENEHTGYPVDILPFRGVEQTPNMIAWPPDMKIIMNVIGYEDALAAAVLVTLETELTVPIASIPGLALLKLFAWKDRHAETPQDAQDFVTLLREYYMAGNQDRMYGEESSTFKAVEYEIEKASPRLLGIDVRRIASATVLEHANLLLKDPSHRYRLTMHMATQLRGTADPIAAAEILLEQFEIGLTSENEN